jgi:hypothetical protein
MEPGGADHGGRRSVFVNPDGSHHAQANSKFISESLSQARD